VAIWRMAFKAGNQGQDMFGACREYGVAAYTFRPIQDLDLTHVHDIGELYALMWGLPPSPKSNVRKMVLEMRPGDTIYVKDGTRIVGRGTVTGPYGFDPSGRIMSGHGVKWSHQVPVAWEEGFEAVEILLGAELTAILELRGERLARLEAAVGREAVGAV
jgi:hypothetical protein